MYDAGPHPLGHFEHVDRSDERGFQRHHRIVHVIGRRRRAGQVVDAVDLFEVGECDVVPDQVELRVVQQVFHVLAVARDEIVHRDHFVPVRQQTFAQVAADETGSAGNEYLFFHDCIKCLKRIKQEPFQEILWICEDGRSADVCNAICCCTSY